MVGGSSSNPGGAAFYFTLFFFYFFSNNSIKFLGKLEIALLHKNDACISPDEDFTLLYITIKFVILHTVTLKGSKIVLFRSIPYGF